MKSRYNKTHFLLAFTVVFALIAVLQHFCHFSTAPYPEPTAPSVQPQEIQDTTAVDSSSVLETLPIDTIPLTDTLASIPEQPQPTTPRRPLRAGSRVWSYTDCFPDVQEVQLASAQRNGIQPVQSRSEIPYLIRTHQLVDITNSPFYVVDDLTHSLPYLVPKAQHLLNTISINFLDSLRSKGMQPHLPVVSSVLRTIDDVTLLQHGNRNATTNSCHTYGTTLDIAYHRFIPLYSEPPYSQTQPTRWDPDLTFVLAEVLYDLRAQGLCYVKYERKQACFHLTLR